METNILFITSRHFYEPTVHALSRMELGCSTSVVPYDSFEQIVPIYETHCTGYDAVLITGTSAKHMLELKHPEPEIPIVAFQVDSDALHRDMLRFAIETQNLDFSRIAIDCLVPLEEGYSVVDFMQMTDLDFIIRKNVQLTRQTAAGDVCTVERHILEQIIRLWEEKAIDMVFCLYPSIVPELQKRDIPFRCPYISDAKLYQLIQEVLVRVELNRLHENHPAVIQIFPRHSSDSNTARVHRLYDALMKFMDGNHIDGVLQESSQCCTVISSMGILRFLTDDFQHCRLSSCMQKVLDFPVCVGYGIGTTIVHATNNVQIASKEAKLMGQSFLMDSNGNLIGPLNSDHRLVIPFSSQPDVTGIAKRCQLSAMTIQKLQSIVRNNGTDKITIPEIAHKLNTTVRNANRIMLNLCRGHVARPVYTQAPHSRGRPIQVYALDFETPLP